MKKSKILMTGLLSTLAITGVKAQVQDVSVTVSPLIEYNWWNKNIQLKDAPFWGARVGFGFGPFFELRGTFEKSLNLKNELESIDGQPFNQETLNKLDGMKIDVTRFGGEAKVNILGNSTFSPYITAGTGVQIFDYDPFDASDIKSAVDRAEIKEKQLYLSIGAGLKFNFDDRIALSLEAKNIRFNMDANNSYINPTVADEDKQWGNWAALASLDFYLGGNINPQDQYGSRYRNLFTDGFKGPKFVIEPGIAFVDFANKMLRRDQWFMGGSAGVDFSSLIGIRGFYYQATETPDKLSFDFNKDLKMYGGNLVARLNFPRGIVPYLQLGAGYLDDNNYIDTSLDENEEQTSFKKKNLFALAGAGIEIPMSRWFALYGTYNAMLMTNRLVNPENIQEPSDLVNNQMFTAGLRINLGNPETGYNYNEDYDNDRINRDRRVFKEVEREACEKMTKKEFEEMVDRILNKIRKEESARISDFSDSEMAPILAAINQDRVDKAVYSKDNATDQEVLNEMRALVRKMDNQVSANGSTTTIIATDGNTPVVTQQGTVMPAEQAAPGQRVYTNDPQVVTPAAQPADASKGFAMNRLAVITGVNFGESTMWNIGLRGYMQISNTNFDFMPELFIGIGNNTGYGLSANVVYNFNNWDVVTPYAGLGLGFYDHGAGMNGGANIILGCNINTIANGAFFVDYTSRSLFKNNQIAVGYRFVF